ncbi:hypothetical protein [Nostoc sp.]|uniref:hypothetical protein n=1 Tax=Nostoc sp. TaxID=1180 RepID=UPI00359309D4
MSLTSFLEIPDVRAKFQMEFKKPKFDIKRELLAPPLLGAQPRLVGTAFDYLLRFYVKYLNPQAEEDEGGWAAERALRVLKRRGENNLYEIGNVIVAEARHNYLNFLETGKFSDELLKSALSLGKLDPFTRRSDYIVGNLESIDNEDIADLRNITNIIDPNIFRVQERVLLNPDFGPGSLLVKGADADLILDDLLIDVKTTIKLTFERKAFDQLLGYYTLSVIERRFDPDIEEITRLGIYFSRHAYLYEFPVDQVINPQTFPQFLIWFEKRAQEI